MNDTKTCEVLAWCPVENDHNIPEYELNLSLTRANTCNARDDSTHVEPEISSVIVCASLRSVSDAHLSPVCL